MALLAELAELPEQSMSAVGFEAFSEAPASLDFQAETDPWILEHFPRHPEPFFWPPPMFVGECVDDSTGGRAEAAYDWSQVQWEYYIATHRPQKQHYHRPRQCCRPRRW